MLHFLAACDSYRKMMFLTRTTKRGVLQETLADHYVRLHGHLIRRDVEVWELNKESLAATCLLLTEPVTARQR